MAQYERLVFGLTWRTAISDDRKELIINSKELNANSYVEAHFDVKHKYGFINLKSVKNTQAAAVVVGQVIEGGNGIFVHQINREEHCFIAVRDTLPVEDCDIIADRETVIQRARDYASNARKADGVAPKVYGDATEISGYVELHIDKLVEEGDDIARIQRVSNFNPKLAFGALAFVLIAGSWFGPDLMSLGKPKTAAKLDPTVEHHKAVVTALDGIVALKQFPANVMPGYIKFLNALPAEVKARNKAASWKLDRVVCEGVNCTATWKREGAATYKDFLESLSIDSNDPTISFPSVDAIERKLQFTKDETPGKLVLGTQLKFGETVLSWLQTLKDRPRTDTLTPLVPANGEIKPAKEDMPLSAGYSFTVPYSELSRVESLPSAITIERSTLTYQDSQNIKIEFSGKYYAL